MKTEPPPEYIEKLALAFKEQQSRVCAGSPETVIFGEGKQYRSVISVVGAVVVGLEKIKTPDKSGFVLLSRFLTKNPDLPKINVAFPIYVPTIKSHAWPGVVSMVAVANVSIPNTVALRRIGGWRKRAVFAPIQNSFSNFQSAYEDSSQWDPLTRKLNSDDLLLDAVKDRWDGGMQELELHIKTRAQLIPHKGKTILEYSVMPKPSGFWATGYQWDFRLEEGLDIFKNFLKHIKTLPKSDSKDLKGKILDETSLALQDILKGNAREFQGI